jgi:sulfate transport system substrate-binding protein
MRPLPALATLAGLFLVALLVTLSAGGTRRHLLAASDDAAATLQAASAAAFAAEWQADTGERVAIRIAPGGSAAQAAAVIGGLEADLVTLAAADDIDAIAAATGALPDDWRSRLPHDAAPYTSTVVFLVRGGNPLGLADWHDLARPGVRLVVADPRRSSVGRWSYLAAWGSAPVVAGDRDGAEAFVRALYGNVVHLVPDAGAALQAFVAQGLGDALLLTESEALRAAQAFGPGQVAIVVPRRSILVEPGVAVVGGNAEAHGTQDLAEGYLAYLFSPAGQSLAAQHFFRPASPTLVDPALLGSFPPLALFTVDAAFGGWARAAAAHFAAGGLFEQIRQGAMGTELVSQ